MVDTIRTMASLTTTYLADNAAGDISPNDVRDFAVSAMTGGFGGLYVTGASTAQTSITTTDVLLTAFTAGHGSPQGVTENSTNDRLEIDRAGRWLVYFGCSYQGAANVIQTFTLRFDAALTNYKVTRKTSGTDVGAASLVGFVTSAGESESLEVYVKTDQGGGASITVEEAQLVAVRIGE